MEKTICQKEFYLPSTMMDGVLVKASIEATLTQKENNQIEFSATGEIRDIAHRDYIICGQCLDEIVKLYPNDDTVQQLHTFWKNYHLNTMHAGCIHQREFEKHPYTEHAKEVCQICNYEYGTDWKYEPIPETDLKKIKDILTD